MEEQQEFEKPVFEFHRKKFRSSRVLGNRAKETRSGESMNHYEELYCSDGLTDNPKKNQKFPLELSTRRRNKKSLIRCKECGKGFLYEKCLANHRQVTHSKEYMGRSLLCNFSAVQRRKRSKRVSRYKKSPRLSVSSSSFTIFPVSVDDEEVIEVAESLILLSKSGGIFLNGLKIVGEALEWNQETNLGDGFLRNEQKLVGTSKKLSGYLGDKKAMKDDESGQQKHVGTGRFRAEVSLELEDRPGLMLQNAEKDIDQKLGSQETVSEDSNPGNTGFELNIEHRCGLCDKVFSTYQSLGGHQTLHRMRNKSKSQTKRCREESVEAGAEINGSMTLTHKCRVCSRLFRSVQALRGHKKCHRTKTFD